MYTKLSTLQKLTRITQGKTNGNQGYANLIIIDGNRVM